MQDVIHFAHKVDKRIFNCKSTPIFCDNSTAGKSASSMEFIAPTKHVEVSHLWIQQEVAEERIKDRYVNTKNQVAHIFTKSLALPLFEKVEEKTWTDIIKGNVIYHFLLLLDLLSKYFSLKITTSDF